MSELKGQRGPSAETEVIEESENPDHAALNLLQEGTSEVDESEVVVEQTPVMFCVSDAGSYTHPYQFGIIYPQNLAQHTLPHPCKMLP